MPGSVHLHTACVGTYRPHTRAHADSMRRETSALRSAADGNKLSGTLPAALGALTDLVALCARPLPQACAAGTARRGPASAESVRSRARAVLRSSLHSNGLTGTIGGWIGSLAKLTLVDARARACMGGYPGGGARALTRAGSVGGTGVLCAVGAAVRPARCGVRAHCARVCVFVCVCVCVCVFVWTSHRGMHAVRAHASAAWPCVCACTWYDRRVLHEGTHRSGWCLL